MSCKDITTVCMYVTYGYPNFLLVENSFIPRFRDLSYDTAPTDVSLYCSLNNPYSSCDIKVPQNLRPQGKLKDRAMSVPRKRRA